MTPLYILFALVILVLVLILIGRAARRRQLRRDERWEKKIKLTQSDRLVVAPSVVKSRSAPSGAEKPGGAGKERRDETGFSLRVDDATGEIRRVGKSEEERSGAGDYSWASEPSSRSGAGGVGGAFGSFSDEKKVRGKVEDRETAYERAVRVNKIFRFGLEGEGTVGREVSRKGVGGLDRVPESSKQITAPPQQPSPSQKAKKNSSERQATKKKLSSKQEARILQASAGETHRRKALEAAQRKTNSTKTASDTVDCTVFAPPAVPMRDSFMIQVFAHLQEQAAEAQKLAQQFDREAEARGFANLEIEVERGSKLTFHLVMPGLEIDEPLRTLVWRGSPASVQFGGTVIKGHPGGNVIGTVTISQAGVPVGHIKFKLTVTANKQSCERKLRPAGDVARHYERAFVSYASQDRDEVLKRVQMLARLGIEYFQDVLTLEPGQRWERELYRHIDESDLFLLFWSSAAKQSQWVHREIQYAIACRGDDELAPPEIVPIPIEGPPLIEPPPELAHLHFNDYLLYFMAPKN